MSKSISSETHSLSKTSSSPRALGYRQPAEWAPHSSCWLAWPSHGDLWLENLAPAQAEFVALCSAIVDIDPATGRALGEKLDILTPTTEARKQAEKALAHLRGSDLSAPHVRFHDIPFGDIWVRDTAPIFIQSPQGLASVRYAFNGWGEKYVLPHDSEVSVRIQEAVQSAAKAGQAPPQKVFSSPMYFEGGSIEVDGEGTGLTTRQCLLNANRNPGWTEAEIAQEVCETLGLEKLLWLDEGLLNDHTDGHIDTLVRFVEPGVVILMEARSSEDPNAATLQRLARDVGQMTDARGRQLQVRRIPSPGKLLNDEGEVMPASYVNFYIGNSTVVVPIYGTAYDTEAVQAIGRCFPGRKTVGCSGLAILNGGGSFHCITQQQPLIS